MWGGARPSASHRSYATPPGLSCRLAAGRDAPAQARARWLPVQSEGSQRASAPPFPAPSPGQCRGDVAGETQAEDRAISQPHTKTGHGFPAPRQGWEQRCWLQHGRAWPPSRHGAVMLPWTSHIPAFCLSPLFVKWTQILHKGVVKPN